MARIWLPITYGGRTRNILIPGSQNIDDNQLDEIIQWQKEKTLEELKALPPKQPISIARKKEIAGILKEFGEFIERKKSGELKKFY